ncbi:MAG: hypothetical protein JNL73_18810 [Anaerolineales bacterium]|nr:hypothetical protein [Anaerolineales bacterium]
MPEIVYDIVLFLHSILRYVIVLAALGAVVLAFRGWFTRQAFTALDERLGMIFTSSMHLQLLIGLLLYAVFSPLTQAAFMNMGAAMTSAPLRFYAVEHIAMMILAVIVATVGRVLSRRAKDDAAKHRMAAIFYTIAIILVFVSIPWPWAAEGAARPLNPFHMFTGD